MSVPANLVGQTFGFLIVLKAGPSNAWGRVMWWCRCECGNEKAVATNHLRSGHTKSCGCWRHHCLTTHAKTHGLRYSPEYPVWHVMKQRCTNPKCTGYKNYGGRGITVCKRWSLFENFIADMGPRPSPDHSIERKDNSGPYSPENCVWSTRKKQARNKRNNRFLTHGGETLCLTDWSERTGIKSLTIYGRLLRGWSIKDALTIPLIPSSGKRRQKRSAPLVTY